MDTENEPQPGPSNAKKKSPKSNNKMPNIKEMSKDEIQAALIKKRQCDADAQKIVERLIENPVPAPWFVYCLRFINQCHLDDVFEERSLINQCGYPICLGVLPNAPKKQYMISTKLNKIYDITERKKFCTDKCFNAAVFIREQMLTSPLWLRDKEEIPDFKLLPWSSKGIPGLEINFGVPDLEIEPDPTKFTSVTDFAKSSLNDAPDTFEEMEKQSYLEEESKTSEKLSTNTSDEKLSKLIKKSNENQQRINRKTIENHFSEIVSEDDLFKYNKHQLKLISLSDRSQARKLSEEISKESLKERLENRRKAMLKQQNEAKSTAKKNTSTDSVAEISDKVKTLQINPDESTSNDSNTSNTKISKPLEKFNSKFDVEETKTQDLSSQFQEKCEISTIQSTTKQANDKDIGKSADFPVQEKSEISTKTETIHLTSSKTTTEKEIIQNSSTDETLKINNEESKASIKPSIKSAIIEKINEELPSSPNLAKQIKPSTDLSTTELAINYIEKCLSEWFTIDSLLYLYGRERVKNDIESHNKVIQEKLSEFLKQSTNNLYENEAYIKLCKKIDMLELEEERYEKSMINRNLKPLPDYRMLRAENKRLTVKVRSFYNGHMEFEEPGYSDSETSEDDNTDVDSDDDEYQTVLPAVDKNSQNLLRRQIVFNCLSKTVPGLLQTFGLTSHDMTTEIRQFISTFYLTAKNIIFKPIHLNLLGVIILRLLGEKNRGLFKLMEETTAIKYSTILLGIYKLPYDYLDKIVTKLTNIESIVDNHCTTNK